jgi:hypothetical protein
MRLEASHLVAWTAVAVALSADPATARDISVNCGAPGASIQAALARFPGEPLRVEIRGECRENVVVTRSDVELVGVDPAAGIRTPAGDRTGAPLTIRGSRGIAVHALKLSGGDFGLVAHDTANHTIDVRVEGVSFEDNNHALKALRSRIRLVGGQIASEYGAFVLDYSNVDCFSCDIEAGDGVLWVQDYSTLVLAGSEVRSTEPEGLVAVVTTGSVLDLRESVLHGGIQTRQGAQLLFRDSSAGLPSPTASPVMLSGLSRASIDAGSSVALLWCKLDSDAYCEPGSIVNSDTFPGWPGCSSCPPSP